MHRAILSAFLCAGAAATLSAQATDRSASPAPSTLRLTVDEAVKMALDHNVDLVAARLEPQVGDTRVASAMGAFRPAFSTSDSVQVAPASAERARKCPPRWAYMT